MNETKSTKEELDFYESVIKEIKNGFSEYVKAKFSHNWIHTLFYTIILTLLLSTILLLAYWKIIDGCTIGTLLGSIVGYTLGRYSMQNNGSSQSE